MSGTQGDFRSDRYPEIVQGDGFVLPPDMLPHFRMTESPVPLQHAATLLGGALLLEQETVAANPKLHAYAGRVAAAASGVMLGYPQLFGGRDDPNKALKPEDVRAAFADAFASQA